MHANIVKKLVRRFVQRKSKVIITDIYLTK